MTLVVRNAAIEELVDRVHKLTKAKTKAESVRLALEAYLAQTRRASPIAERLARSKALADAMGPSDPSFDMKQFTDEMWRGV